MSTIGERIRCRRKELDLSQAQLAKMLGYKSRSSINKIELNLRKLGADNIKAIADVLMTTPAYIMGWDNNNEQTNETASYPDSQKDISVPWLMGDDVPMSKANNAPCISPTENTVLITRRTGKKSRYTLEDKQTDLIEAMLEQMPKSEISYGEIAAEGGSLNRSKKKPETTL